MRKSWLPIPLILLTPLVLLVLVVAAGYTGFHCLMSKFCRNFLLNH